MRPIRMLLGIATAVAMLTAGCGDDDDDVAASGDVIDDAGTDDGAADDAGADDDAADDGAADDGADDGAASVSFTEPASGATVARRFDIAMAVSGVELEPAGEAREGAGHLHVMIDVGCLDAGEPIPRDDQHVHFGKGQADGQLFLEPGEHELCLQLGDGTHVAQPITDEITVTVDADEPFVSLGVPAGETVSSPLALTMEASGVTIEPAGEVNDDAGHFHLMVDEACVEPGETIPNDETHLHFGDASTETELELPPGEHQLCLQVGDGEHTALPLTHRVTVVIA